MHASAAIGDKAKYVLEDDIQLSEDIQQSSFVKEVTRGASLSGNANVQHLDHIQNTIY